MDIRNDDLFDKIHDVYFIYTMSRLKLFTAAIWYVKLFA